MCLIEKFIDVYPQKVRKTKIVHRCPLSDGRKTCNRTPVYSYGEVYHRSHFRPKNSYERALKLHQIIEPADTMEPEDPPVVATRTRARTRERSNYHAFSFLFPFSRRRRDGSRDKEGVRERSPRPYEARFPEARAHAGQTMQKRSPQRAWSAPSRTDAVTEITPGLDRQFHTLNRPSPSQQQEAPPGRRRQRKRTPVEECRPRRGEHQRIPVQIHSHRPNEEPPVISSCNRNDQRSSRAVYYITSRNAYQGDNNHGAYRNVTNERREPGQSYSHAFARENSGQDNTCVNEPEHTNGEVDRQEYSHGYIPWYISRLVKRREEQRSCTRWNARHARPQIIQEGHCQMAAAGNRVFTEAQERQSQETIVCDFRPSRRPWNRRYDHSREPA